MLSPGLVVFVNFPEESPKPRVLHAAKVVQNNSNGLVIRCDEPGLPVEPERAFRLYYELKMKFVQHTARIEAVLGEGEMPAGEPETPAPTAAGPTGATIIVKMLGEPVSAESRECYRVSTLMAGLKADVGDARGCVLADVSVSGFSVIAEASLEPGSVQRITLHHEGKTFVGEAAVQSVKDLGKGKMRFGFVCADASASRTPLKQGLQQISVAVQRQQLKRLAGAAA